MYAQPQKTNWRGVAALVGRQGGDLPVYFYEDIGAAPFSYYRPNQPQHRVIEEFGDDGNGWRAKRAEMEKARDGFWLVMYPTSSAKRAEEPAIERWLSKE